MKVLQIAAAGLILAGAITSAASPYFEKDKGAGRLLTGKVTDRHNAPLKSAEVVLSNTRTRAVKTYIVSDDGAYRFASLSPNIDYEVYAQFQGKKSDTKTVSQFDNRPSLTINLKVDIN